MARRLIAIVGQTATGKTALGIALARRLDGEIINADSRQVYRGMDVGTAKPSPAERAQARHWLIDVLAPDEPLTLSTFLELAHDAADDIWSRGKLPLVVGGTGQYIRALLEGWQVPKVPPQPALRAELEALAEREGADAVRDELRRIDPASAETIDARNVRRMIRAIEVTRMTGRPFSEWGGKSEPDFGATVVGLRLPRDDLYRRIDERVDAMIRAGLFEEVRRLNAEGYGCGLPSMSSIGYREACQHLQGELSAGEAAARIKTETHRLARVQDTWFRNDPAIRWLDADDPALVETALALVEQA